MRKVTNIQYPTVVKNPLPRWIYSTFWLSSSAKHPIYLLKLTL